MSRNPYSPDNTAFWAIVCASIILMGVVFLTTITAETTPPDTPVTVETPIEVPETPNPLAE